MRNALLDLKHGLIAMNKMLMWLVFAADPGITFSAWVYLRRWRLWITVIDWLFEKLFGERNHCERAASWWEGSRGAQVSFPSALPLRVVIITVAIWYMR